MYVCLSGISDEMCEIWQLEHSIRQLPQAASHSEARREREMSQRLCWCGGGLEPVEVKGLGGFT